MRYFLLALIFSSCMPGNKISPSMVFDKQGHRGCRSLMPENTIPAMMKAIDLGVNTLEMDVVITKDKRVILSHEPFFNHEITTKPDGKYVTEAEERFLNIYQMTYEQTRAYDVGSKPHPRFPLQAKMKVSKPLLSDVIDSAEVYSNKKNIKPVFYNIETKSLIETDGLFHPAPADFVELVISIIISKGIKERVIIQSFDPRTLQYLHKKYPAIRTAFLVDENDNRSISEQLNILGFKPAIYSPHYSLITEKLITNCHDDNILVIPWTVNETGKMSELKQMGVDGIITDNPVLFSELK